MKQQRALQQWTKTIGPLAKPHMIRRLAIASLLATASGSCTAAEEKDPVAMDTGDDAPIVLQDVPRVDGKVHLNYATVERALVENGRTAEVVFTDFTVDGETFSCPTSVSVVDRVCRDDAFESPPSPMICRWAGDSTHGGKPRKENVRKIRWKNENRKAFTVTFDGMSPCKGMKGHEEDNGYATRRVCTLKDWRDIRNNGEQQAIFKYNIKGKDERCAVLDPFFIARR